MKQWEDDIRDQFQYLSYAPIVFVSALTKQRLHKLPEMIKQISESQNTRIPSAVLNDVIMDAIAINPTPTDKGKRLKIFYATQVATKPPTFVVFVNEEELMHFSYLPFLRKPNSQGLLFLKELQSIWLRGNGSREYETNGSKWRRIFQMIKCSFFQLWKQLKVAHKRCFF